MERLQEYRTALITAAVWRCMCSPVALTQRRAFVLSALNQRRAARKRPTGCCARDFTDRKLTALENHPLDRKTERRGCGKITILRPLIRWRFSVLRRRGRIHATMEQWGYRWQDLRKTNPALRPALIYDPAVRNVDDAARAIGGEVCALFCAYDETDKIDDS